MRAKLTSKTDIRNVIIVKLDNDYRSDCVKDLEKLDSFLNKVSLDVAVSLVNREGIKASSGDVNDAIFGEVFGRKGLRVSLMQSARGENKDRIDNGDEEVVGVGLLRGKDGRLYVNGKLESGRVDLGFIPRGIVSRVKDLFKFKLGLECGRWVKIGVDEAKYDLEIID